MTPADIATALESAAETMRAIAHQIRQNRQPGYSFSADPLALTADEKARLGALDETLEPILAPVFDELRAAKQVPTPQGGSPVSLVPPPQGTADVSGQPAVVPPELPSIPAPDPVEDAKKAEIIL